MSTPTPKYFFVYAPDKTEEGTFEKRMSVRSKHLEGINVIKQSGFLRVGGVLLTPESIATPDSPKKMIGSTFICTAESIDEYETTSIPHSSSDTSALADTWNSVIKQVHSDIYYTSGVWDTEKVVVLPILPATPIP